MRYIWIILIGVILLTSSALVVASEDCGEDLGCIERQIADLNKSLSASRDATRPLEQELGSLGVKIASIQSQVNRAIKSLDLLEASVSERSDRVVVSHEMLSVKLREMYKRVRTDPGFRGLVMGNLVAERQQMKMRQETSANDRQLIVGLMNELGQLEADKKRVETEKKRLSEAQIELNKKKEFLAGEVNNAKKFQSDLNTKIASLSARQQAIIDAKSGSFTFTLGSGELADEYLSSAKGFMESAPGGHFAVFSLGGYSHRKGMSQYGARGRAEAGQNYREILRVYYGKEPVKKDDTGGNIRVVGNGEIDFETTYLYGIAEMPSSWHVEALKAQAIAARTYAYRYKRDNREICITQSCQVFSKSKSQSTPQAWKDAVDQTRGEILEDVVTFYSSTSGGFLTTSGWDTIDGNGGADFMEKSYERKGGSPWLEKAWWREGYSVSGATCGRSNPWLSPEEMADIVNAVIALRTGGVDTSRISPVTTSCWGGNPYSLEELRILVSSHGGIARAENVTVSQGNGVTSNIVINGISMSANDFRRAFNLRAPGHLRIPQYPNTYGNPFINIVRK
jgi:peptidoglycan hydrolase CwlO-like protein